MATASGKPSLSLKMRAIALLAQRDQSVVEMRRKLLRIARQELQARRGEGQDDPAEEPAAEVERLLVCLQAEGFLSEQRFVESRVQARAQRWGNSRIRQELAQHGLSLDEGMAAELRRSELERAASVRERKFGSELPVEPGARAKQMRFLAGRGFSADIIQRVLRAEHG